MKKLTSILSLLIFGAGIQASAGEHEEVHSLTYSVYQSYRFIPMTNTDKVLATQEQARKMLPGWNATPDKLTGMFRDMYGPAAMVPGNTNMDKAQRFMSGKLSEMGVNAAEWIKTRDISVSHASFVNFKQVINGHEVVLSDLAFRFTPDGRLQRIKMKNFGTPAAGLQPELSASDVLNGTTILEGLGGVNISEKRVEPNWVWFPIPAKGGYIMHPAWTFAVNGTTSFEKPVELSGYIDAITGELLYRSNSVNETFETTVDALLYMIKPTNPRSVERVKHMTVTIAGTDYLTDDTGFVSVASANAPVNVTYKVKGPWSDVRVSNSTPTFTANMTISPSAHSLPVSDSTSSDFRAVSAFFYVNAIHDYMKSKWPSFTGMDNTPLRTNVDINGTDCNAYYSNGNYSINFYPPQGASCRAFSTVPDIVFHEYGHGISYKFYASQGTNFSNGAMGEGNSDVWAMCINQDGVVGEGSYYNGANIRSYIGTPKVYPGDIKGEVHADGEIIAGAWWDVAINTGSGDTMAKLFALTYYDTPNGPDGTEGEVYHDVLISALMNDDDDANLGNGTPHFSQIVAAFARHGIYLLSDAQFEHTEVPHQPINTAVAIKGNLVLSNPAFFDKLFLFYRDRYGAGTWDSVAMTNTTGNEYAAQIPGLPGGS
ncbi:MAG: M36 family metallopeptidase, partial [Chitinophagaceae bacterium]|nr:M36 family metallopeptidase [Chitinophagaceae bacterium]